ncbi:hypothetical protein HYN56_00975 [Flavobacterium crocinum]|uniref:Uncharacterized protein n=1 Tax=Flavobacterium crocinum TaxID=2183896 RepID=A0A2S1YFQ5_9FLAO|nr:hypothetical protein HYN56_00975 [Flavobacterium crocinum]
MLVYLSNEIQIYTEFSLVFILTTKKGFEQSEAFYFIIYCYFLVQQDFLSFLSAVFLQQDSFLALSFDAGFVS